MSCDAAIGARSAAELPPRERGFSLIEVLAVVLLTALVVGVTANTYLDISRATQRAAEGTRALRHATAVLDRIARDLQGAMLVLKPPDVDPLAHPWLFLAENEFGGEGSDRIKFMTRGRSLRNAKGDTREADFEVIAYRLSDGAVAGDGLYDLYRWSSPRLPESLDTGFPDIEDASLAEPPDEKGETERSQLLAENVERFQLRFEGEDGEWQSEWDSSQLEDSSALPVAVEIEVALYDENATTSVDEFGAPLPPGRGESVSPGYKKMVVLQLRPIDLAARLDPKQGRSESRGARGEEDEEGGSKSRFGPELEDGGQARERADRTIGDCVAMPLPEKCQALAQPHILSQPFAPNSRHIQVLIGCGATVQADCR